MEGGIIGCASAKNKTIIAHAFLKVGDVRDFFYTIFILDVEVAGTTEMLFTSKTND